MKAIEMRVRVTFIEDVLGTASANPELHEEFIASKAPDAATIEEEVAAIGADGVFERGMTVFPRTEDGTPFLYDYQIKGFFKDACGGLRRVADTESSKLSAHKKIIDTCIFVRERRIPFTLAGEPGVCQRPLRASTAQGERVALSSSESIPEGSSLEFTIVALRPAKCDIVAAIREWLDYGRLRGMGQWRNSGKGRFAWVLLGEIQVDAPMHELPDAA